MMLTAMIAVIIIMAVTLYYGIKLAKQHIVLNNMRIIHASNDLAMNQLYKNEKELDLLGLACEKALYAVEQLSANHKKINSEIESKDKKVMAASLALKFALSLSVPADKFDLVDQIIESLLGMQSDMGMSGHTGHPGEDE